MMPNGQATARRHGGDDGDAAYLDKTLRHEPTETRFDDTVSWRTLFTVWYQSAALSFGIFVFFGMIWLLSAGPEGGDSLLVVGLVLAVLSYFAQWVLFLIGRQQETISEWRVLLSDRAAAVDSVYSHVVGRLRERSLPIEGQTRRTPTGFGPTANRLVLIDGHYEVYVSVFTYGTSLYLGWSMWRIRNGAALLAQFFADHVASRSGRLDPVGRVLRTERPRAMREAVHAVCREALHYTVENITVPESYGFPGGLPPIEELPSASAPRHGVAQHGVPQHGVTQQSWPQPAARR